MNAASFHKAWTIWGDILAHERLAVRPTQVGAFTRDVVTLANGWDVTFESMANTNGASSIRYQRDETGKPADWASRWWEQHGARVQEAWRGAQALAEQEETPMSRSQPRTEAPEAALQAAQEACQACSELSLTIAYLQSQLRHTHDMLNILAKRVNDLEVMHGPPAFTSVTHGRQK